MSEFDFSRFDPVLSSVIVIGQDLRILYANPAAHRRYPLLLSSDGLTSCFSLVKRKAISADLRKGIFCREKSDFGHGGTFLFEPVTDAAGQFRYAFVFVEFCVSDMEKFYYSTSEAELLNILRSEILIPMDRALKLVHALEQAKNGHTREESDCLRQIRECLIRSCTFASRMDESSQPFNSAVVCSDLSRTFREFSERIPGFAYAEEGAAFVALDFHSAYDIALDILSALICYGGKGAKITGALLPSDRGYAFRLSLDRTVPGDRLRLFEASADPAYTGLYFTGDRIRRYGGTLEVSASSCESGIRIDLTLPRADEIISGVEFREQERCGPDALQTDRLEHLIRMLSEETEA